MNKLLLLSIAIFALATTFVVGAGAQTVVHYQSQFTEDEKKQWVPWSNDNKTQRMEFVPHPETGKPALHLTMEGTEWNTATINFPKPIKVTPNTVFRFKIKSLGIEGLNIGSSTTGARFFIGTSPPAGGKEYIVQDYFAHAVYKSGGKPGTAAHALMSMVDSDLSWMQISTRGPEVWISEFQVFEADTLLPELPVRPPLVEGNYQLRNYPILNNFFPYGAIYHGIADFYSGGHFGQTQLERYDMSLFDIKRHHMNTFANFVDPSDIDEHFKLAKKHNLKLFETRYAGVNIAAHPEAADIIKKYSTHPNLLAWYGDDEPTPNRYKAWIDNKLTINNLDPHHLMASAFSSLDAAKTLGPYSEVLIVDPYTVQKTGVTIDNLLWHANYLRAAKRYAAGKKVWFIAQSYGDRANMRYPNPAEARFEVFNSLSAGVDGLIFFIHSDMPSYLEPHRKREKFDNTLIDPWYNGNATYDELARIGRDVIPAMTSLMDKTEIEGTGFTYDKDKLVFQAFQAKPGKLIVIANKSLDKNYRGQLQATLGRGQAFYDLIKLAPVSGRSASLNLAPGDGGLFIVADAAAWQTLKNQILARKLQSELELADADTQNLKAAQFNTTGLEKLLDDTRASLARGHLALTEKNLRHFKTGHTSLVNTNPVYVAQKKTLAEIRQSFGAAHRAILTRIETLDGTTDPTWTGLFSQMKQLSKQFFEFNRQQQTGSLKGTEQTTALKTQVLEFQKTVESNIAALK